MNRMQMVRVFLSFAAVVCLAAGLTAQAPPPAPEPGPVVESYYKLAPGKTEEWLEIYRTNHLPVLRELQRQGRILSITLYRPVLHQGGPPWDFKVILVWRDFAAFGDRPHEEAVERKIFSAWLPHREAERRRWEITEAHWDDLMAVLPVE